jgi:NhaP-type Na+/H+ or K+/H+ antiporter
VAAFLAGLASVATLPLAVYLTRYSDRYELIHAGFAIPLGLGLGALALALVRRARTREALRFVKPGENRLVTAARVLGIAGVFLALSGLVALGVYGLLEYVGSRD